MLLIRYRVSSVWLILTGGAIGVLDHYLRWAAPALDAATTIWLGGEEMPIYLDHTIVPATDKEASARFFAKIFGLEYKGPWGHFAPVKVNETLSLDFDNREVIEHHHYAFIVSDEEFDAILDRIKGEGLAYGSGPRQDDMQINHLHTGRGFYFNDPNGHRLEVITHTYI